MSCLNAIFQIEIKVTNSTHSRRALFRVFDIESGQIEDIVGIILVKEFFKKSN